MPKSFISKYLLTTFALSAIFFGSAHLSVSLANPDPSESTFNAFVKMIKESSLVVTTNVADAETFSGKGIAELSIDTDEFDIQIEHHDLDDITIVLSGEVQGSNQKALELAKLLKTTAQGSKLMVSAHTKEYKKQLGNRWFKFFAFSDSSLLMTLKIPRTVQSVTTHQSSGDLRVLQPNLKSIKVQASSGDTSIVGGLVKSVEFIITSGDFDVTSEVDQLKGHLTSGDITIASSVLHPNMDLATTSGDIKVTVPPKAFVNVQASATSGEIELFGTESNGSLAKLNKQFGAPQQSQDPGKMGQIKLATTSGDIEVESL